MGISGSGPPPLYAHYNLLLPTVPHENPSARPLRFSIGYDRTHCLLLSSLNYLNHQTAFHPFNYTHSFFPNYTALSLHSPPPQLFIDLSTSSCSIPHSCLLPLKGRSLLLVKYLHGEQNLPDFLLHEQTLGELLRVATG